MKFRNTAPAALMLLSAQSVLAAEDPYLWLEDVEGEKAIEWVKAQNAGTSAHLEQSDLYKSLYADVLAALNAEDRLPELTRKGGWLYQNHHSEDNPRGLYRRIEVDAFIIRDTLRHITF